jgi:transposase-like protein
MGGPRIAEEMKKRVIEAYRECGNHSMIARWFGIGDTSVRRICEGVAPRTKSRPFFRKMSPGEYNNREKAEIVREADASRDCVVGAKHGINPKTISTWRNRGFGREK